MSCSRATGPLPVLLLPVLLMAVLTPAARGEGREDPDPEPPPLGVTVRLRLWGGLLRGELQTPRGGRPGSSSLGRPTLDEVGLGGLHVIPEAELGVTLFGAHELHLSDRLIMASGRARLREPLVTQGIELDAGARVQAGLDMQLFRLTYRPHWFAPRVAGWEFQLEAGLAVNTFLYTLREQGATERVHRGYLFASPYLGLLVTKQLAESWRLELQVGGSAFVNGVTLAEGAARVVWTPLVFDRVAFGVEAGVEVGYLRRRDNQPLANDPSLLLAGVTFGLRFDF